MRNKVLPVSFVIILVSGLLSSALSADFDLPAAIARARCDHAASPLFFPCVIPDTTAGSQIKADSEMTVYSSAIHPDIVYTPGGWNGHRWWASFSPYPHLVSGLGNENPHVECSDDGVIWTNRVGKSRKQIVRNPIDRRSRSNRYTHLSDPDLILSADSTLWVVYRAKYGTQPDTISFLASGSRDGINWSRPTVVLSGVTRPDLRHKHAGLSPSLLHYGGKYHLWYINAQIRPHSIFHYVSDSLLSGWRISDSSDLGNNPGVGADIWHMNVIEASDGSLLGLFTFTDSATHGQNCKLRLAASVDGGKSWTFAPRWLLEHAANAGEWDGNEIYRSGGYFDREDSAVVFRLYYSAMRLGKVPIWSTGRTTIHFDNAKSVDSPGTTR